MWRGIALIVFLSVSAPAAAAPVTLRLDNGLTARANYQAGEPGKPAVLLLHGFLQTYDFPTIHRMFDALAGEGYTVLAPNLTLGVTHRGQSLACEAVHTHTMEGDGEEIAAWLAWLKRRHKGPVVLIGHSIGSLVLLNFLDTHRRTRVAKLIGVSIVEGRLRYDKTERAGQLAEMRQRAARGDRQPVVQQFSFCQRLTATPESYASYLAWSPEHILRTTRTLAVPVVFIMGGRDDRLGAGWIEQLRKTPARVHVIEDANHFMDGEHEFDLMDRVLAEIAHP